MLVQLSILSLHIIESLVLWRECTNDIVQKYSIKSIEPRSLKYESSPGQNYVLKLMEDTLPVFDSKLYKGARYPDPFFLSYPLDNYFEERDLVYKIRASELALL